VTVRWRDASQYGCRSGGTGSSRTWAEAAIMATGKRRSATSVILDTQKLHTLQTASGFTQDEIAGRAGVSLRTEQRAFGGDHVRPYMGL
jgi:hypothetical protein